jgi:hypothetical protein
MAQNDMRRPIEEPEFNVSFWHKAVDMSSAMSAFGDKADIDWRCRNVCF